MGIDPEYKVSHILCVSNPFPHGQSTNANFCKFVLYSFLINLVQKKTHNHNFSNPQLLYFFLFELVFFENLYTLSVLLYLNQILESVNFHNL